MNLHFFHVLAAYSLFAAYSLIAAHSPVVVLSAGASSSNIPNTMRQTIVNIVDDEAALVDKLWEIIAKAANEAIANNAVFRVGLSGGSLINFLAAGADKCQTDWSKWQLFFCDERFVDDDNEHSTFGQYKKLFIPKTKLNESQFVTIDRSKDLTGCAKSYAEVMLKKFNIVDEEFSIFDSFRAKTKQLTLPLAPTHGNARKWEQEGVIPRFDLLLLGMGPDGHTCSLFPGHPLLNETGLLIAPIADSPKPPPERITMTYPLINNAKVCLFPISGKSKASVVKDAMDGKKGYPAGLIRQTNGKMIWLLDDDAASVYTAD